MRRTFARDAADDPRTGVIVLSNAPGGQLRVGPPADRLLELMVAATK